MLRAIIPTSLRLGLTKSGATSVEVVVAITITATSGLNAPNVWARAALLAPDAGEPESSFKIGDRRSHAQNNPRSPARCQRQTQGAPPPSTIAAGATKTAAFSILPASNPLCPRAGLRGQVRHPD